MPPTPSHRAASAAKGKGSAGPVRRRRKTGTLDVIPIMGRYIKLIICITIKKAQLIIA